MSAPSLFISYTHADEWLKDELIAHLGALKRNGTISVWHDRMIAPGAILDDAVREQIEKADLFILLVSPQFISSDYCYMIEYKLACDRHAKGEAEIIPVIVRECDWDVGNLRSFAALPKDAVPVTKGAGSRTDTQLRDGSWLNVVEGIRHVLEVLKKKRTPPSLEEGYADRIFKVDFIRHPSAMEFDERDIFVDPDIYYEKEKEQLTNFSSFVDIVLANQISIVTGGDRSGKSLIAKKLQITLDSSGNPSVLVRGRSIKNVNVVRLIEQEIGRQYGPTCYTKSKFSIIVDDFDDCALPDRIKEQIIIDICLNFEKLILFSFTSATSVLFTSDELPSPIIFNLNPLANDKIYRLVIKWKSIGAAVGHIASDAEILPAYEKIQMIFDQSEIERSAYTTVTFLELLDSAGGGDIAVSSFASCYETLVTNRLHKAGIEWRNFDESKNFLAYLAYRAFVASETKSVSHDILDNALNYFNERYLSSKAVLRRMALGTFISQDDEGAYSFREEYLWFFLVSRHVALELSGSEPHEYRNFITRCTQNIFNKKFANIAIFVAYFSNDNFVLESLITTLKGLFSKADIWELTDEIRELMLGIKSEDNLSINSSPSVEANRFDILRGKINDIIGSAMKVVAQYTLPFLQPKIADSVFIVEIDKTEIDADSYMRSVNALLRTHSVLGQILATRAGTFPAIVLLDCISNMVKASGRYAALNHAIATVLIHDDSAKEEIQGTFTGEVSAEERLEKVQRIFAFWSVYLSQAGLARYLSNDHAIRALEKLIEDFETSSADGRLIPFNYSSVLVIAKLYASGKVNKKDIENCIKKYGEHSAILELLRVAFHIYTYYMPLEIEEKQWLSSKLRLPMSRLEAQRYRASDLGRSILRKTRRSLSKT